MQAPALQVRSSDGSSFLLPTACPHLGWLPPSSWDPLPGRRPRASRWIDWMRSRAGALCFMVRRGIRPLFEKGKENATRDLFRRAHDALDSGAQRDKLLTIKRSRESGSPAAQFSPRFLRR